MLCKSVRVVVYGTMIGKSTHDGTLLVSGRMNPNFVVVEIETCSYPSVVAWP